MSEDVGHSLNRALSHNLRLIYALRKQSLEDFSSELGIGHTTLQNILHQKSNLTLDTVDLIAERLRTSPYHLLSNQYSESDLACAALVLEAVEFFLSFPSAKRKRVSALLCQLLEVLAQEE